MIKDLLFLAGALVTLDGLVKILQSPPQTVTVDNDWSRGRSATVGGPSDAIYATSEGTLTGVDLGGGRNFIGNLNNEALNRKLRRS